MKIFKVRRKGPEHARQYLFGLRAAEARNPDAAGSGRGGDSGDGGHDGLFFRFLTLNDNPLQRAFAGASCLNVLRVLQA
jgi:hypothetical protein